MNDIGPEGPPPQPNPRPVPRPVPVPVVQQWGLEHLAEGWHYGR